MACPNTTFLWERRTAAPNSVSNQWRSIGPLLNEILIVLDILEFNEPVIWSLSRKIGYVRPYDEILNRTFQRPNEWRKSDGPGFPGAFASIPGHASLPLRTNPHAAKRPS